MKSAVNILMTFWAVVIGITILSILAGFLIYCHHCLRFRIVLHFSWCMICLIVLIAFLLVTLFFPVIVASFEGCEIIDKYINTKEGFKKYSNVKFINSEIGSRIESCIIGDGYEILIF